MRIINALYCPTVKKEYPRSDQLTKRKKIQKMRSSTELVDFKKLNEVTETETMPDLEVRG